MNKKLLSLFLAAMLALCALSGALAEAPEPVEASAAQAAYDAFIEAVSPQFAYDVALDIADWKGYTEMNVSGTSDLPRWISRPPW